MDDQLNTGARPAAQDQGTTVRAPEKTDEVAHEGGDRVDRAKHAAQDVAQKAERKAGELAHEAARRATTQADEQKHRVAQGIHTVADALRRGSSDLPSDEREYSPYVHRLADGVDRVSDYIERRDVRELGRDVERFARDNATAFIGGAFALGVLGARFVKSSSSEALRPDEPAPRYETAAHELPSHVEQGRYVPPSQSSVDEDPATGGGHA